MISNVYDRLGVGIAYCSKPLETRLDIGNIGIPVRVRDRGIPEEGDILLLICNADLTIPGGWSSVMGSAFIPLSIPSFSLMNAYTTGRLLSIP